MHIIAVVLAAVTAATTSIAHMRTASARSEEQPIPLLSLRPAPVPLWPELVCCVSWCASAFLLTWVLPTWAAMTVYCAAAVLPWELMRHRHNSAVTG